MAKFKTKDAEGNDIEVEINLTADSVPQDIRDQIVKQAQGISYGNIDGVASKYGFNRPDGTKTSDFIDTVLSEYKTKVADLEDKISKAGESGDSSEELERLKADLEAQKKIATTAKEQLQTKEQEFRDHKQAALYDAELSGLDVAVPEHITDEDEARRYKQAQLQLIKSEVKSKYKLVESEDGKYRLQEGNESVLNDKNEIATIRDVANKDFKSWLSVPKADDNKGTGGQGKSKNDGRGGSSPKSFEDVMAMAADKQLSVGSPEYSKFVNDTVKEYNVAE
jgi:hypothetical protein